MLWQLQLSHRSLPRSLAGCYHQNQRNNGSKERSFVVSVHKPLSKLELKNKIFLSSISCNIKTYVQSSLMVGLHFKKCLSRFQFEKQTRLEACWRQTDKYPLSHQKEWYVVEALNWLLNENETEMETHAHLVRKFSKPVPSLQIDWTLYLLLHSVGTCPSFTDVGFNCL